MRVKGDIMKFVVSGVMKIKGVPKAFVKELEAASESRSRELIYQQIGSDHRLSRTQIKITKIEEMSA